MSQMCKWLHEQAEALPAVRFPFQLTDLPDNGIYIFYEEGENWGHGGDKPRIVRIGTHRDGNFRSRIRDHYRVGQPELKLAASKPAPKDRSIFRKNLGRAILNRTSDPYLRVWEIDFTSRRNRETYGHLRDIEKERKIETQVTGLLRRSFSFRYIVVDDQVERMGGQGLEAALIGTVAACSVCRPSSGWLGNHSPKSQIARSGLWLVQHLDSPGLTEESRAAVTKAIGKTLER